MPLIQVCRAAPEVIHENYCNENEASCPQRTETIVRIPRRRRRRNTKPVHKRTALSHRPDDGNLSADIGIADTDGQGSPVDKSILLDEAGSTGAAHKKVDHEFIEVDLDLTVRTMN
ncbi:MAG: hypothetical protein R3C59_24595 [Planctomycetaceae bacterium]